MTDIKVIALFYELFSMFISLVFVCCLIITLFVLAFFAVKRILKNRATAKKVYYRVQCGVFSKRENAERLQAQLTAKGIEAIIIKGSEKE